MDTKKDTIKKYCILYNGRNRYTQIIPMNLFHSRAFFKKSSNVYQKLQYHKFIRSTLSLNQIKDADTYMKHLNVQFLNNYPNILYQNQNFISYLKSCLSYKNQFMYVNDVFLHFTKNMFYFQLCLKINMFLYLSSALIKIINNTKKVSQIQNHTYYCV